MSSKVCLYLLLFLLQLCSSMIFFAEIGDKRSAAVTAVAYKRAAVPVATSSAHVSGATPPSNSDIQAAPAR
jgi:uncharacterized membrane protein